VPILDITGQRFGRLTAIAYQRNRHWLFQCDCGEMKIIDGRNVCKGDTRSCGCLRKEVLRNRIFTHEQREALIKRNTVHGLRHHPAYDRWRQMLARCHDPEHKRFSDYGGRGIVVCARWHMLENFIEGMGDLPKGLTIERVDNDGNYELMNCKWATYTEQNNNHRPHRCSICGETGHVCTTCPG
jgi:hypothetical protein